MVERRTLVFFVLTSLLFGGTFVAAKAGLDYFPPLLFVALRFDVAAVALAGYAVLTTSRDGLVPRTRGDVVGILSTGVLAIGLTNALLFVGQQYATSAVASIVFSLNPVLTPVFAAALLSDERLSARGVAGMILALVGVGLVVSPDPANLLGGAFGKSILFTGAIAGALGSVLIRWADADLSSTVRTAWGLPFAAVLCHLLSWSAGESAAAISWTPTAFVALGYVGIFAGAVAYITYFGLIDETGAIRANLVFYVVPVVATLGGVVFLGETISASAVAGFATIFAGFAILGSESVDLGAVRAKVRRTVSVSSRRYLPAAFANRTPSEKCRDAAEERRGRVFDSD
ncbi:Permease of the drug/metabolite transporter (DMT) superfamily [Halopelagius inordinatus]|uniref:Permease of the drug/metabolite transporter (DMT) superfamily n=1 Tax=Halopelagius inordinatus TaxID=553467 RepID=A0A1I2X0A6_9EURY|nr:DMT family transporter [Halopelagius inordinatus]SFH06943.1 Permease of the drug/metabolite transporter (DMT) superfamily [Halopelagius inordinatus]